MGRYVVSRVLQSIPVVLIIVVLIFFLMQLAPGDPVLMHVGEFGATKEFLQEMRVKLGLDRPLYEQLGVYLWRTLRGDLGYSFYWDTPVTELIQERIPATLLLMIPQYVMSAIIGIWIGVYASKKPNSLADTASSSIALAGYAVPIFWLGQMLMLLFAIQLDWLPVQGMRDIRLSFTGLDLAVDIARHLVLPVTALTLNHAALVLRLTRASMLEVLRLDYITFAKSKGLSDRAVTFKHALRNALLPVVTILGYQIRSIIAGTMLVETVFAWPGIGRLMYESIARRDYPVALGVFFVIAITVVVASLIVDIMYSYIDPRIRYKR
jgi:peptide/nickel transport system permease protein